MCAPGSVGLLWELGPRPPAPEARMLPRDQTDKLWRASCGAQAVALKLRRATCGVHSSRPTLKQEIEKVNTLGFEPKASRMLNGCDATTPCAQREWKTKGRQRRCTCWELSPGHKHGRLVCCHYTTCAGYALACRNAHLPELEVPATTATQRHPTLVGRIRLLDLPA